MADKPESKLTEPDTSQYFPPSEVPTTAADSETNTHPVATGGVSAYVGEMSSKGMIQTSTTSAYRGALKFVQAAISPSMFATPDSALIFVVPPVASAYINYKDYTLLGMCESFGISHSTNFTVFKEYRCEETFILPQKSGPGNLSLTRLQGAYPNLMATCLGTTGWKSDRSTRTSKKLFGIMVVYLDAGRTSELGTMYFERCANISSNSVVQAAGLALHENVSITFGRVRDDQTNGTMGSGGDVPASDTGSTTA